MTDHDTRRGRQGSEPARVPPHNLEAEEAAIGAALLSVDAFETLDEMIEARDFYKPTLGHVFRAMSAIRFTGDPLDVVTVADQLRRDGLLDECGGIESLNELQNRTPSVSGVATYGRIVRDSAQLRRLLSVGAEITDLAYSGNANPSEAVVKAQELIEGLDVTAGADLVTTLEIADIAALLETDLQPERGTYLTRTDGTSLFYEGKAHVLQAEPSAGKSWIALTSCVEALELGGSAGYLDFEDTPAGILRRMRYLGADEQALRDRFWYCRPLGKLTTPELGQLDRVVEDMNFDIVIIDGVGESLARNGMSEDKADDVLAWYDLLPRRLTDAGATVVMIDHVSKDPEHRGRWARGSGAKLGALDGAAYQVKVAQSFSRNKSGVIRLVVAKDRPGGVGAIGETAALIKIEPHGGGERVIVSVEPYSEELAATDPHKPTHVMTLISKEIEEAVTPVTKKNVEHLIGSKAKKATIAEAVARLLTEGYVTEVRQGRSKVLKSVRPYRGQTWHTEPPELAAEPVEEPLFELAEDAELEDEHRASLEYLSRDPDQ